MAIPRGLKQGKGATRQGALALDVHPENLAKNAPNAAKNKQEKNSLPVWRHFGWLDIETRVERLAGNFHFNLFPLFEFCFDFVGQRHRQEELRPGPMVIVPLFNGLVQFRSLPSLSTVDANVDAFNLATATTPGDSFQGNVRSILGTDRGILRWVTNEGSHGLFVDDGSLIETGWRPIGQVLFKGNVRGKSTVGFALVAFLGLFVA
jgi:hypothetical protein